MKNKSTPYSPEARELVRNISMYPGLSLTQLCRFQPCKKEKICSLLSYLTRQGRIMRSDNHRYYSNEEIMRKADGNIARAVWILLDFIDKVQFHAPAEFPAILMFFGDGQLYEVIHVPDGQENMFNQLLFAPAKDSGRRIVLVDSIAQIDLINFPNIVGFCTATEYGEVQYYQKGTGQ